MSPLGDDHAMEGSGGGLRVVEGRHRNPTHGRQDKSAAAGRAHVVGWTGYFGKSAHRACWRSHAKVQQIQRPKRRRSLQSGPVQP